MGKFLRPLAWQSKILNRAKVLEELKFTKDS